MMSIRYHVFLIIFALTIFSTSLQATIYYSVASGNFGTLSNWNTDPAGNGTQPGSINSADDFVIQNGYTITNDGTYTINSLTIESGGTYDGNANTITLNGDFTQDGTFTDGVNGAASMTFAGSATQSISGSGSLEFNVLTFSGTGTYNLNTSFAASFLNLSGGTLNAGSATITLVGVGTGNTFDKTGGSFNAGTSLFIFSTTATGSQVISSNDNISFYNLEHSPGLNRSLTFAGNVQISITNQFTRGGSSSSVILDGTTTVNLNGATLIYTGSASKTIAAEWPIDALLAPNEVQINSGITVTADPGVGNTLQTNYLSLTTSGSSLSIASGTVQVNTKVTLTDGTIVESGGAFAWGTGTTTLLYNGASQQTVGAEWTTSKAPTHVQINNSSATSPALSLGASNLSSLAGDLTLTQGSVDYSASSLSLSVAGNVVGGSGSFGIVNANTLIVTGATSQVTSSGQATLHNLTITSSGATLSDIVIAGTLTVNPGSGNTTTLAGAITLQSGAAINVASGTLNLNGFGITKVGSNTLTLAASSQLTTGGTSISGFSTYSLDPTSTILFNGAISEDIPAGVSYGNIQINKSGATATVNGTGSVVLQDGGDLTVLAGTFNLNAFTLQLGNNSDLIVQGGIADLAGGTLSITATNINAFSVASGATLRTGGTSIDGFDSYTADGTLVFNGSAAETIPAGLTSVNNLTIDNSSGVSASADMQVSGALTLTSGTFTPQVLTLTGSLTVNGGTFSTASGSVVFQGSSQQTIAGTAAVDFYNLTINNANGVVLSNNATVYGVMTFSSGVFNTNGNLLSLTTSGSFSGASSSSYIEGKAAKSFAVGTSANFTFPTAKDGQYLPVTVTFTDVATSTYTVTVEQFNADPHTAVSSAIDAATLSAISSVRYWSIDGAGGTPSNLQITLSWNSSDGISNLTALDVAQYNGTQWISAGGDGSGTASSGTIQSDVITSSGSFFTFGDDAAGGQDNSLPVTLSTFNVTASFEQVSIEWATESEVNNSGFNLYRRTAENDNWTKINDQLIPGAGNSSVRHQYSFVDDQVVPGETYSYRLESVAFNGQVEVFNNLVKTVTVPLPTDFMVYQNYPNPFNPKTTIKFQLPEQQRISVLIYDINGNLIKRLIDNEVFNPGEHQVEWDALDDNHQPVSSGTYFYRFVSSGYSKMLKMIYLK
ncbi:T9SS type A sorting domain-containing protein [Caldithrix abyssi]